MDAENPSVPGGKSGMPGEGLCKIPRVPHFCESNFQMLYQIVTVNMEKSPRTPAGSWGRTTLKFPRALSSC